MHHLFSIQTILEDFQTLHQIIQTMPKCKTERTPRRNFSQFDLPGGELKSKQQKLRLQSEWLITLVIPSIQ